MNMVTKKNNINDNTERSLRQKMTTLLSEKYHFLTAKEIYLELLMSNVTVSQRTVQRELKKPIYRKVNGSEADSEYKENSAFFKTQKADLRTNFDKRINFYTLINSIKAQELRKKIEEFVNNSEFIEYRKAVLIVDSVTGRNANLSCSRAKYEDIELLMRARQKFNIKINQREELDIKIFEYSEIILPSMLDISGKEELDRKSFISNILALLKEYRNLWSNPKYTHSVDKKTYLNAEVLAHIFTLLSLCNYEKVYDLFLNVITNREFPNALGHTSSGKVDEKPNEWISKTFLPMIEKSPNTKFLKDSVNRHKYDIFDRMLKIKESELLDILENVLTWISEVNTK